MQITILNVAVEDVKTAKGGYQRADVAYKDDQGKTSGKKVMSFVNQKVFDTLKTAKSGDVFDIKSEKDANNFWQWIDIAAATASPKEAAASKPSGTANYSPKSTYETPEERAHRQILIIRQSSIASAVNLLGNKAKPVDVIGVAKEFEAYVTGQSGNAVTDPFADMKDDIPL